VARVGALEGEIFMAKSSAKQTSNDTVLTSAEVPDQLVEQVGKAVVQIMQLRKVLEEELTVADSDEQRQVLANQTESAAVRAISDQGLSITEYNRVIAAAESDADLEERVLGACRAA
jgi:citrate lyase gamma subunit